MMGLTIGLADVPQLIENIARLEEVRVAYAAGVAACQRLEAQGIEIPVDLEELLGDLGSDLQNLWAEVEYAFGRPTSILLRAAGPTGR